MGKGEKPGGMRGIKLELVVGMVCGVAYSVLLKKTIRKVVPSVMVALVVW